MNVLWVEDFGGSLKPEKAVFSIFKNLISQLSIGRTHNLKKEPSKLNNLASDVHDFHEITLCRHYFDFKAFLNSNSLQNIDVILLDLNLSEGVDLEKNLDESDTNYDHKRGGLWMYNYLILQGFPKDNICILTGEDSTLNNFREQCNAILMPESPVSFEKSPTEEERATGFEGLRNWLSRKEKTPYLQLRRGIISGCQFICERIKTSSIASIQFQNFLNKKPTENELKVSLLDYLETLEKFFLATEPVSKTRTYKLFLRTLAHEWENNANSNHLPESDKNTYVSSFGWIMKNLRNWMAHNVLKDDFTEQDVAFLFITAMRCMFKLPDEVQRYEWAFFSLFEPIEKDEMERLLSAREIPLASTYLKVQKDLLDLRETTKYLKELKEHSSFNELLNTFQQNKGSYNYNVGLYQIYWLTLPKMETNIDPISVTNNTASFNTQHVFNETNSYGFNDWKTNEKHFLFHFSRHIYKNSFP